MNGPTVEQAERILEVMNEWGLGDDVEIRESYSGRGMYGSEVVAFTGDGVTGDVFLAIGILIGSGEFDAVADDAVSWFSRMDSMGRGWVIY